jgi:hypothetical protein
MTTSTLPTLSTYDDLIRAYNESFYVIQAEWSDDLDEFLLSIQDALVETGNDLDYVANWYRTTGAYVNEFLLQWYGDFEGGKIIENAENVAGSFDESSEFILFPVDLLGLTELGYFSAEQGGGSFRELIARMERVGQ